MRRRLLTMLCIGACALEAAAQYGPGGVPVPPEKPATPQAFALRQLCRGGACYFFDADFQELTIDQHCSNVVVYAIQPAIDSDGYVGSLPGVEAWFDARGHIHSVIALKEQVAFNRLLIQRYGGNCRTGTCFVAGSGADALSIRPIPLTGIMDEETFMIPIWRLELKFDALFSRFHAECAKVAGANCIFPPWPNALLDYWWNELQVAKNLLATEANYRRSIFSQGKTSPQPVPNLMPHWKLVPGVGGGGGISDLGDPIHPMIPRGSAPLYARPGSDEPERTVNESLNPLSDGEASDPSVAERLWSGAEAIKGKLLQAERDGNALFPVSRGTR